MRGRTLGSGCQPVTLVELPTCLEPHQVRDTLSSPKPRPPQRDSPHSAPPTQLQSRFCPVATVIVDCTARALQPRTREVIHEQPPHAPHIICQPSLRAGLSILRGYHYGSPAEAKATRSHLLTGRRPQRTPVAASPAEPRTRAWPAAEQQPARRRQRR